MSDRDRNRAFLNLSSWKTLASDARATLKRGWSVISGNWYRSPARFVLWLILTTALVLLANQFPQGLLAEVTMTIDVETEVFAFRIDESQSFALPLPRGTYSLFAGETGDACSNRGPIEILCPMGVSSSVEIEGPAQIELAVLQSESPDERPRFMAQLLPLPGSARLASFRIVDESGRTIGRSREPLNFESEPVSLWRTHLDLNNITLGDALTEGTIEEPFMSEGRVRFFARIGGEPAGRFLVESADLDAEDTITLEPALQCPKSWGTLPGDISDFLRRKTKRSCGIGMGGPISLGSGGQDGPKGFAITMHSNRATLDVKRPRGGYTIRVTNWEVLSEQPALLAIWAAFISLMLIVTYVEGHRAAEFAQAAADESRAESRFRRRLRLRNSKRQPEEQK